MKICVIGAGYVGLVTGACFSEVGHNVVCIDSDVEKISNLRKGFIPIHEPGLSELIMENTKAGRLVFGTKVEEAIDEVEIIFIAVGTPALEDGSADLSHVLAVAEQIGSTITHSCVVVTKSTVPVGTSKLVEAKITEKLARRRLSIKVDIASNPEFLKEGEAIKDFMRPDRIIVGSTSSNAKEKLESVYGPFNKSSRRLIFMGPADAEMTKYAANSMLAAKISFINEISLICDSVGVDVENVRLGIGSDERIGYHFIYPGCGYGGSCFPKDVKALISTAEQNGLDPMVLKSVDARNVAQKTVIIDKILSRFRGDLRGLKFAVWGLAFKPGTDDIREAPSAVIVRGLLDAGAHVKAFDPVASDNFFKDLQTAKFSNNFELADDPYSAVLGCDALIVATEWKAFRVLNFPLLKQSMRNKVIFDGRNIYDKVDVAAAGFEYFGIGR